MFYHISRCHVYSDLPSTCYLVKDPQDACCTKPQCSGSLIPVTATGTPVTGPSGTNVVPIGSHTQFSGSGRPTSIPGQISGTRGGWDT